jgi:hypothetical protein
MRQRAEIFAGEGDEVPAAPTPAPTAGVNPRALTRPMIEEALRAVDGNKTTLPAPWRRPQHPLEQDAPLRPLNTQPRKRKTPMPGLDIVGDVHGERDGLLSLLSRLGYNARQAFDHANDRRLVFVGDLVDGGPDSLGVSELVLDLCQRGRALCLMGNHELNLLEAIDGGKVRASTRPTYDDALVRPQRWAPVLAFFRTLPLALETDALRIVHAVWDAACLELLTPLLAGAGPAPDAAFGVVRWWGSPVREGGLLPRVARGAHPRERRRPPRHPAQGARG